MVRDTQCRAITRNGLRCKRQSATAGFCKTHFPTTSKSDLLSRAKAVGQVVTTATGIVTLIEKMVELWQSLPFGPGPTMPDAYHYLADEFGPSYPSLPSSYAPGTYGAQSIDWSGALDLYEFAKRNVSEELEGEERQTQTAEMLSVLAERFIDEMEPTLRSMLLAKIGEQESAEDA